MLLRLPLWLDADVLNHPFKPRYNIVPIGGMRLMMPRLVDWFFVFHITF